MQCSPRLAATTMPVSVAGAYVRKAAYRQAEGDLSPLHIGGRKNTRTGAPSQDGTSVTT